MKTDARGCPVPRVLRRPRWITRGAFFSGAVLVALALAGCPAHVGTSKPPPCPRWSQTALVDYAKLLDAEDAGQVAELPGLHEHLERTTLYCLAIDAFRGEEVFQ